MPAWLQQNQAKGYLRDETTYHDAVRFFCCEVKRVVRRLVTAAVVRFRAPQKLSVRQFSAFAAELLDELYSVVADDHYHY